MGSSIPAWGTKILEAVWHGQKNSKKKLIIQKKLLNTLILKNTMKLTVARFAVYFALFPFRTTQRVGREGVMHYEHLLSTSISSELGPQIHYWNSCYYS